MLKLTDDTHDTINRNILAELTKESSNMNALRSIEKISSISNIKFILVVKYISYNIELIFFFSANITTAYSQMIEGLKRNMNQNKNIYKVIYEVKTSQEIFQKEICEKISEILEKVN